MTQVQSSTNNQIELSSTALGRRPGKAKRGTDCYTCAAIGLECDRQRPQCNTCLDNGKECAGFLIPLSWNAGRMWVQAPTRVSSSVSTASDQDQIEPTSRSSHDTAKAKTKSNTQFKFVLGPSRKRRKVVVNENLQQPEPEQESQPPPALSGTENDIAAQSGMSNDSSNHQDVCLESEGLTLDSFAFNYSASESPLDISDGSISDPFSASLDVPPLVASLPIDGVSPPIHSPDENDPKNSDAFVSLIPPDYIGQPFQQVAENGGDFDEIVELVGPTDDTGNSTHIRNTDLGLPRMFSLSMETRHAALLELYDSIFCVLPLTSDMQINPFRITKPSSPETSNLLSHAILALSCQHLDHSTGIWSREVAEHRSQADSLLDLALRTRSHGKPSSDILDSILILFTQDCAISALGSWDVHLTRALAVLEASGGILALDKPRTQAQVAMLLWWDATLALVSRKGLTFDRSYLHRLLQLEKHSMWSFYGVSGCPGEMMRYLVELAELAEQAETAATMTWLTFDLTPVLAIEKKLTEMNAQTLVQDLRICGRKDLTEEEQEEEFHEHTDRVHCVESWRQALLLYIERVFKWDRTTPQPKTIRPLLRSLLDCIIGCRKTSQTQKQMLLPLFLAGSETLNESMQQVARDYCAWWAERSRYHMFYSVSVLLEELWVARKTKSNVWWGSVVDSKTTSTKKAPLGPQFLFG